MTPELWQRVCTVLAALEPMDPDGRAVELDRLRSTEPEVAVEVEGLLSLQDTAHTFNLESELAHIWVKVGEVDRRTALAENQGRADKVEIQTVVAPMRGRGGEVAPQGVIAESRGGVSEIDPPRVTPVVPEDPDFKPPAVPGYVLKTGKENVRLGGMGVVYFGKDESLGRPVAVKVLRRHLGNVPEAVARFDAEARVNAQLQHPGIVPVHEIGKLDDGRPFYTMKRVRGEEFSEVLKRRLSPSADLLAILSQFRLVCEALAYAHSRSVLHRDLKPQNVMVGDFGEVLLMDWGLTKVLGEEPTYEPTSELSSRGIDLGLTGSDREPTRGVWGTIPYMPPEQAAGRIEEVDKRSDVFGLGAILCTILTGSPPYIAANAGLLQRKALEADLDEAYGRLERCGADPELVLLSRKCLSRLREDRLPDAGEVAKAVASYLAGVEERRRQAEMNRVKAEAEAREQEERRRSQIALAEANAREQNTQLALAEANSREQKKQLELAEAKAQGQKKRRRVELALAAAIGLLAFSVGGFAWWEDKQETNRRVEAENRNRDVQERNRVDQDRILRNREALTGLVGECEDALRADEADRAAAALAEADRRMIEGGGEALANRLIRCRTDLGVLTEVIAIDNFRWTPVDSKPPDKKQVGGLFRTAFEQFGVELESAPVEESARRVTDSLVKERLLSTLDLWLQVEPRAKVRAILNAADPDVYREGIRDAILDGKRTELLNRIARAEALEQPAWFATALGQNPVIPKARRYEILKGALQGRPRSLAVFMSLGRTSEGQQERPEVAVRWFQAAVIAHPNSKVAHNNLARVLFITRDLDDAIREFEVASRLDPKDWLPHIGLATAQLAKGDHNSMIRECRVAIDLAPNRVEPHNGLALAMRVIGDLDGAIREYNVAINLDPQYGLAHYGLGEALVLKGDLDGAIRAYNIAVKLVPNNADAHYGLANALKYKDELDGAIREYKIAINLVPNNATWHNSLGLTLYKKGDLNGAIRVYKVAINLDSKFALPHYNLGNALHDMGDVDGAIREYIAAINLDPKLALPHNGLGIALMLKGDMDGAIREFKVAINLDPKEAWGYNNLGNALRDRGDLEDAIREFNTAINLDPKFAHPHNGLGIVLYNKGNWEGAAREYKTAINLDPKFALPHNNLGNVLLTKGDLDGAIQEYKAVIKLDPKLALPHNGLGAALYTKGDLDGAIIEYRQAIQLKIPFATTYNNLSSILCERGEAFAASQVLREGLQKNPRFINDLRYNLSCAACLMASGRGKDTPAYVDQHELRREALGWLTADLVSHRELIKKTQNRPVVHKTMLHWLDDSDLELVRDIEKLPAMEREGWAKLWADVRHLRDDTAPEIAPLPRIKKQ